MNKAILIIPIILVILPVSFAIVDFQNYKEYKNNQSQLKISYKGYIIMLSDKSIIEKRLELEKQKLNENIIKDKLTEYNSKLESDHKDFKQAALIELKKKRIIEITGKSNSDDLIVLNKYTKVFNGISLEITDADAKKLKELPGVVGVYPNYEVKATLMDSIPLINADDVWQLDISGANCLISGQQCLTGKNIKIAIIDTGVDYTHPDLGGCFGQDCKVAGGYDFVNNDNDPIDDAGHGTHVAATAAGNGILKGVAPDANIYAYKVLSSSGSGTRDNVIAAVELAIDPNNDNDFSDRIDIISLSLGVECWKFGLRPDCGPDDPLSVAVDKAVSVGTVVVTAAGNSGPFPGTIGCPACARKVIAVGATYKKDYLGTFSGTYGSDTDPKTDQVVFFSSRGPMDWPENLVKPDIVAPGAFICAARYDAIFPPGSHPWYYPCLDDNHVQLAGTSMSTPMVSGLVALLRQKHLDWQPLEIRQALRNTAVDTSILSGKFADIHTQGYGRIDVLAAINLPRPSIAEILTKGKASGNIDITGSAYGNNFRSYTLFYKDSLGNWNQIYQSSIPVINGLLYSWNVGFFDNGIYDIKLIVDGNAQSTAYSSLNIINTEIIYPEDISDNPITESRQIFPSWKRLTITGSSTHNEFDHYTLEWCPENTACTLIKYGENPVSINILGEVDLSTVSSEGFYTIKLTTYTTSNTQITDTARIYVSTRIMKGWPVLISTGNPDMEFSLSNQPVIIDINKDATRELLFSYGKQVSLLNYQGQQLPGWPVTVACGFGVPASPAAADLNNDNEYEIISTDSCGNLHILKSDGSYLLPPRLIKSVISGFSTPVIDDVDNDGDKEIVMHDQDIGSTHQLYILNNDGTTYSGWPKTISGYLTQPAVADLDSNSDLEIIIGSNLGYLYVFNHDGTTFPGWPKSGSGYFQSPSIGNIDNDPNPEIVVHSGNTNLYAFNYDGSIVQGWPKSVLANVLQDERAPSLADINNDNSLEIITASSYCMYAFKGNGDSVFTICPNDNGILQNFDPKVTVANLDSDDKNELLSGVIPDELLYTIDKLVRFYAINDDGTIANNFPLILDDYASGNSVPVADIDNDGNNDVVIRTNSLNLYVYKLQNAPAKVDEWLQAQHDYQKTSNYHWKPASQILNTANQPLNGYLILKIQKDNNGVWEDYSVIQNKIYNSIPVNGKLDISSLWLPQINLQPGIYQAVVEFTDQGGKVLQTNKGPITDISQFYIASTTTSTTTSIISTSTSTTTSTTTTKKPHP